MKKFLFVTVAAAVAALTACNDSDEGTPQTAVATITTYEGTSSAGVSTFTYTDGAEDLITLTAPWSGSEGVDSGRRVIISYVTAAYGKSGSIDLLGVSALPGGSPKVAEPEAVPASEPLSRCSIWRSGSYLNLNAVVTFSGKADEISLYLDEEELNSATDAGARTLTARVAVTAAEPGSIGAERTLVASWDISAAANFEAIRAVYTNASNQTSEIIITL